jgi:hypothetical protein
MRESSNPLKKLDTRFREYDEYGQNLSVTGISHLYSGHFTTKKTIHWIAFFDGLSWCELRFETGCRG